MSIILILILGGIAGYIAGLLTKRDQEQGIILNIVVGIVGAFVANALIAPLLGIPATLSELSLSGFLMSVAGATLLLAVVNLFTRNSVR